MRNSSGIVAVVMMRWDAAPTCKSVTWSEGESECASTARLLQLGPWKLDSKGREQQCAQRRRVRVDGGVV